MVSDRSDVKAQSTLVCKECNRRIEECSFCNEEACLSAVCYLCLIKALGEWKEYPAARIS